MKGNRFFSADSVPLDRICGRSTDTKLPIHGKPTIKGRGEYSALSWPTALAGVDAAGDWHWVARVITVDGVVDHVCDDRCRMARSRTCACSCGGVNHGAGLIQCQAA
jgi:hypothetical protein